MRRPAVLLAVIPAIIIVLVGAIWLALPWLLSTIGPRVLENRLGIAPIRYTVAEVGLSRLILHDLSVGTEADGTRAEAVVLTYDVADGTISTLTIDHAHVEMVQSDGAWHIEGLGPMDALLARMDQEPTAASPDEAAMPVQHLRINAARVVLRSPHGLAEVVVDVTADRQGSGLTAVAGFSATGPGLAAEAALSLTANGNITSVWDTVSGSGQLTLTAQSAAVPGVARGVDGFGSFIVTADNGQFLISSDDGLLLTATTLDEALAALLPPSLRDQIAFGGMTMAVGSTGTAPLHLVLAPHDDGIFVAGAGSISGRMGATTGYLTIDGEATIDADGTAHNMALRQVQAVVNSLPVMGGRLHASLNGQDMTGRVADGIMQADLYVLGENLAVDDISVPRLRLAANGGLSWSSETARLTLRQGRLALGGPVDLGEVHLPQGLDWIVDPQGEAEALSVTLSDVGADIRARLAVPDAALVVRTGGRTVTSTFARAEVDALLPVGSTSERTITLALNDGSLKSADIQASDVYATITEQATGLMVEAEAQVPHLPGETLPLPEPTKAHRPLRVQLTAEHPWSDAPTTVFKAQVREGGLKTVLRLDGQHVLATGQGRATVSVPRLTFGDDLQPESLFGPVAAAGLRLDGDVAAHGTLTWTPKGMRPRLEVLLDDVTLRRGFVEMRHMHGVLTVTNLWPLATPPNQVVAVGAITAGVPFTNAEMTFRMDGRGNAVIDRAIMTLAEGTIHTDPLVLPLDGSGANTVLRVQGLRLDQLAALTELGGLAATGTLHGDVPVELRDGNILFHNGMLSTDRPGSIRYNPDDIGALAGGGGGVDLMLQALSDFQYETLRLTVNGSAAGDLEVGLHLGGRNPDLYSGYPLEFNLTLSGALAQVIEGSLTGYQVPDRIRRHMEQFGVEPGSLGAQ